MQKQVLHKHTSLENRFNSLLLISGMIAIFGLLGYALAGTTGVIWMVILGALALAMQRRASPAALLRMQGAKPIQREQAPQLFDTVTQLAQRADLPQMPALYYMRSNTMNAFAVGTSGNPAIGVTTGLLQRLNQRELTSVLAHEVSHVQHNDLAILNFANYIRRMTKGLSTVGKILLFLNLPLLLMGQAAISWSVVLLLIFAPTVTGMLQLALNRTREFEADQGAVRLTGDAYALATALHKLENQSARGFGRYLTTLNRLVPAALRTHPQTTERIKRLGFTEQPKQTVFV